VFFLKTMVKQKDNLAEKVRDEQALRASLPALSRQILELVKRRREITVKEIEDSTGANRNTIKVHLKKLAEQHYLAQVGKGRGALYVITGQEPKIEACTLILDAPGAIPTLRLYSMQESARVQNRLSAIQAATSSATEKVPAGFCTYRAPRR
jgi:predicted transcriptional regulator